MKLVTKMSAMIIALTLETPAFAAETGLSAKVTHWTYDGKRVNLLLVVDNKSNQAFTWAKWSCQFFSKGEPVGESSFLVENVEPNRQTSKSSGTVTGEVFANFDSTECRLLDKKMR